MIQLLKTAVLWWCCLASSDTFSLNADAFSKHAALVWRWQLPFLSVFKDFTFGVAAEEG